MKIDISCVEMLQALGHKPGRSLQISNNVKEGEHKEKKKKKDTNDNLEHIRSL